MTIVVKILTTLVSLRLRRSVAVPRWVVTSPLGMRVTIALALIAIALIVKCWLGIVAWIMACVPGLVRIRTLIGIRNRIARGRVAITRVRRAWILVAVVVARRLGWMIYRAGRQKGTKVLA